MISIRINKRSDRVTVIAKRAHDAVSEIMARNAENAAIIARQLVPVRTGALRDSIAVEQEGALRFRVVAGESYAIFVETGSRGHAAQPFLMPAIMSVRPQLIAELSKLESRLK